jgi:hypothetical protein
VFKKPTPNTLRGTRGARGVEKFLALRRRIYDRAPELAFFNVAQYPWRVGIE